MLKLPRDSEKGTFVATHLKKLRTSKFFSKCVKFGTKSTHFEKKFQSAFRVYINITFDVDFNALWKKNIQEAKLLDLSFN